MSVNSFPTSVAGIHSPVCGFVDACAGFDLFTGSFAGVV